jgi:hypothetical protein
LNSNRMPPIPAETVLGLAASLLAGVLFLLASLRPRRPRPQAEAETPDRPELAVYWPVLLGTGQRSFGKPMRLEIINQLAAETGDWRVPILLCAREQERDPEMQAAIARALGPVATPVLAAPRYP